MNKIIKETEKDFEKKINALIENRVSVDGSIEKTVDKIIKKVRDESDKAIIKYTHKFDFNLVKTIKELQVTPKELINASKHVSKDVQKALAKAYERVTAFHKKQLPKNIFYKDSIGIKLGYRWNPISAVGLYVPGGSASYPSSVIMNAVPAIVANVKRIVMVCPAPGGKINPVVLYVAQMLNIKEIYKIGGAQAIAALAYGSKSIEKVDKIFGPGNSYVACAKKKVFGDVGIDMVAGPSEILIVADKNNNPNHIAIDLLSQAEHDEMAQSILITDCEEFAKNVLENVNKELKNLKRRKIASLSWKNFGSIILIKNINESYKLINKIAPEHLEMSFRKSKKLLQKINNAGAIFLGKYSPEAIGDYIAGPNHVLPTSRTARFSSGLNVLDFMKKTSIVECNRSNFQKIGNQALTLALEEGLEAHAKSLEKRLIKK